MTAKAKVSNTIHAKPRQPLVDSISELTILVRVPGHPAKTRAFTDEEAHEARDYAETHSGSSESLPLPGQHYAAMPTVERTA
ncbi:hypothetical protein A5658_03540 [Mycobacterium sp. 1245111.1]|uniref:hypothetical protein n=1 Tax=Mycobacterium sp. 1245111.1 TaxID=1834073 RepID=UPI0007FBD7C6|nr:hypothetical protein [Mycobacterium sp. 1245111.1]OBK38605.1 hypothetical protein A5658_03540 [Mycobacterium sp. 1245111.1]